MQLCNNCQNYGHLYYNCKRPITSLGIICYRINEEQNIEYLLVQRKDTLGYVDFLRGKYNEYNNYHLRNIIGEMTDYEIDNILKCSYIELWNKLWDKTDKIYDKKNEDKMNYIIKNKKFILKKKGWKSPEWGFPKGRRNYKETDYEAGIREFKEETGYKNNIKIIKNILPLEEIFTGSNLKSYKHKYFIGNINYKDSLNNVSFQKTEIGNMKWVTYEECIKLIRPYNIEKIHIINIVHNIITNNVIV